VAGAGLGTAERLTGRSGTGRSGTLPAGRRGLLLALVGLALLGATAFGLWHLVVGGLISGNPRAGTFGAELALAAGTPLALGAWWVSRRRSSPD
jgi:hypothetical protein